MNVSSQRRMAADILNVGKHRVWIDPEELEEVEAAVTKDDIRDLIDRGIIAKEETSGTSRGRARKKEKQRDRGRRSGYGSRKGKKTARSSPKEQWMEKIRGLRKELKRLRENDVISTAQYRRLYRMVKGNAFRSKRHLHIYLEKEEGIEWQREQQTA